MKTFQLTHNDLDGLGCVIASKFLKLPLDHLIILNYNEWYKDKTNPSREEIILPSDFDRIFVTDLSIDDNLYEWIKNSYKEYHIFDHHDKSQRLMSDSFCEIDQTRSGTKIWFDFLKREFKVRTPKIVNDFISLVDTYDMWKENDPLFEAALDLNRCFWGSCDWKSDNYGRYRYFVENQLKKFESGRNNFYYTSMEQMYIEGAKEKEDIALTSALNEMDWRIDSRGNKFGVFTARSKISYTCHTILKNNPDIDYLVAFKVWDGLSGELSFRSKHFNVLQLAPAEGHTHAAGGFVEPEVARDILSGKITDFGYKEDYNNTEV